MIPGPRAVLVPMLTGGERCVRSGTPQMPIRVRGGREGETKIRAQGLDPAGWDNEFSKLVGLRKS